MRWLIILVIVHTLIDYCTDTKFPVGITSDHFLFTHFAVRMHYFLGIEPRCIHVSLLFVPQQNVGQSGAIRCTTDAADLNGISEFAKLEVRESHIFGHIL